MIVCRVVTPHRIISLFQNFRRTCCLHHQGDWSRFRWTLTWLGEWTGCVQAGCKSLNKRKQKVFSKNVRASPSWSSTALPVPTWISHTTLHFPISWLLQSTHIMSHTAFTFYSLWTWKRAICYTGFLTLNSQFLLAWYKIWSPFFNSGWPQLL